MSTIRNTVESSIGNRSYLSYAEPVITALTEREDAIKDGLAEFALNKGLAASEVEALFVQVGLSEPTPEPVVAAEPQSVEAMIATLTEEVRSLSTRLDNAASAAARHGVRF